VSLLAWTLRVSAVVGLLASVGTMQLARWIKAGDAPTRIAGAADPVTADPGVTGAIAVSGAARATHLDPCFLPAADRLRP